jgi:hypothetical protein
MDIKETMKHKLTTSISLLLIFLISSCINEPNFEADKNTAKKINQLLNE